MTVFFKKWCVRFFPLINVGLDIIDKIASNEVANFEVVSRRHLQNRTDLCSPECVFRYLHNINIPLEIVKMYENATKWKQYL